MVLMQLAFLSVIPEGNLLAWVDLFPVLRQPILPDRPEAKWGT
jgi:hypothetical protein